MLLPKVAARACSRGLTALEAIAVHNGEFDHARFVRRAEGTLILSVVTITDCSSVLTHRERRLCVLLLLANGYSSKEIARMLDSTKRGIDNDVGWWQDRLDARSRSQVAAIAVARGILSADDLSFDGTEAMLVNFRRRHVCDARAFERGSQLCESMYRSNV